MRYLLVILLFSTVLFSLDGTAWKSSSLRGKIHVISTIEENP